MKSLLLVPAVLVGIILLGASVIYFITPAKYLPSFLPGFDPKIATHHYKHGIAALLLGLGAFAFAWFNSGKKSDKVEN